MAGMLPGVECARRRRFHQSGSNGSGYSDSTIISRRSSFCLYTSNNESHHLPSNSSSNLVSKYALSLFFCPKKKNNDMGLIGLFRVIIN